MKVIVIGLTIFFVLAFASMAVAGGYMIYTEVSPPESGTDVEVTVSQDTFTVVMARATPGLIVFCFGAVGLVLMVYRVPARVVLGDTESGDSSETHFLPRNKTLADQQINMPLLLWWLLRKSTRFGRIEKGH